MQLELPLRSLGFDSSGGYRPAVDDQTAGDHKSRSVDEFLEELVAFNEFWHTDRVEPFPDSSAICTDVDHEFWTAKQRAAHSLHEVSYLAVSSRSSPLLHRAVPLGDDTVYDPFMGRGTTLLEPRFWGRVPFGCTSIPSPRFWSGLASFP